MIRLVLCLLAAPLVPACAQPQVAVPPQLAAAVDAARSDAAKRSGWPPDRLDLISAEQVTWADGSLGCPRVGVLYTPAQLPGWRVQLRVAGEVWDYHGGERGPPVFCPPGRSRPPLPNSRD